MYSGDNLTWISHGVMNSHSSEAPKSLPRFEPPAGPTARTKSAKTPLALLSLFLTSMVLVWQTKKYAQSKGVSLNLAVEELNAFS